MPEWLLVVAGSDADLSVLSNMAASLGASLHVDAGGRWLLRTELFDAITDVGAAQKAAQAWVERINGAARLALVSFAGVRLCSLATISPNGGLQWYAVFQETVGLRDSLRLGGIASAKPTPKDLLGSLLGLLSREQPGLGGGLTPVAWCLQVYGSREHPSWRDLYFVLEAIEYDIGHRGHFGDALVARGWARRDKMKEFKNTVHEPSRIGIAARHGYAKPNLPGRPIPYGEAEALVRRVAIQWLSWRLGET